MKIYFSDDMDNYWKWQEVLWIPKDGVTAIEIESCSDSTLTKRYEGYVYQLLTIRFHNSEDKYLTRIHNN